MAELQARQDIFRLFDAHKYADAAEAAHRYLEQHPSDEPVLQVLADSAINSGNVDAGERILDYLLTLSRPPFRLASKAVARSACGVLDGAMVVLKEGLAIDPAHARSWSVLTGFHKFRANDPLITKAKRVLKSGKASPKSQRAILFTLSKAMNDLRKWDKAWDYAAKATAIETPVYEPAAIDRWIDQLEDAFDVDFLAARPGRGTQSTAPIFIVGMPRSGTTLLESVLASHDDAFGDGENGFVLSITLSSPERRVVHIPECLKVNANDIFKRAAEHYTNDIRSRAGNSPRVVNKAPLNFLYLGAIHCMYPKARLIHSKRNALDTCFSCFAQKFVHNHEYAFNIMDLGHYYINSLRLMAHWESALGDKLLKVNYEDLVKNFDEEAHRLIEFCGLQWEDKISKFYDSDRPVKTASLWQVRQPLYTTSIGHSKNYAEFLKPLSELLDEE